MKRSKKLGLGISATDTQSTVNQLQQTGSFRKHRMSFIKPLGQIKLQGQRDAITLRGLDRLESHSVCCICVLSNLCEQHENDISTAEV